jgi:hypothetical protein
VEGSDLVFITAGTVANSRAMRVVGDFCKGNVVICPRNSLCIVAPLRAHGWCAYVEVLVLAFTRLLPARVVCTVSFETSADIAVYALLNLLTLVCDPRHGWRHRLRRSAGRGRDCQGGGGPDRGSSDQAVWV